MLDHNQTIPEAKPSDPDPSPRGELSGHTMAPLFDWRRAITASDLEPTTRHVALTVSLHMNGIGSSCFPSQATLAAETGLARTTVNEHLRKLRAAGFLRVAHRRRLTDGRQSSNEYQAVVPAHLVRVRVEANEAGVETVWLESPGTARVPQDDTDLSGCGTRICPPGGHHEGAIEGAIEGATSPTPPEPEGVERPELAAPEQPGLFGPGAGGATTVAEKKTRAGGATDIRVKGVYASWVERYPKGNRGSRPAGERALGKAFRSGATMAEIDGQTANYAAARVAYHAAWAHAGNYWPSLMNAATFLNGKRELFGHEWGRDDLRYWPAPQGWSWDDLPVMSHDAAGDDVPAEVRAQGGLAVAMWRAERRKAAEAGAVAGG